MIRRRLQKYVFGAPRPAPAEIRSILVVRRNGIGDMICALPVIRALKKAHPGARLTVLADKANAPAARLCREADEVLVFPLRPRLLRGRTWQTWRAARDLRKLRFDLAVGVSGSFSRNLARLIYATGAGIRVGTLSPERADDPFYYTHYRIRPSGCRTHQVMTGVELMQTIGVPCDPDNLLLEVPAGELDQARRWRTERLGANGALVWLHLSNRRAESRWPAARWRELAQWLLRNTTASLVVASQPQDRHSDLSDFLTLDNKRIAGFQSESFVEFAAHLSLADAVVCGDGGVMHLAAALGRRVAALFSSTEPDIWRPWGVGHTVLKNGPTVESISAAEAAEAVAGLLKSR